MGIRLKPATLFAGAVVALALSGSASAAPAPREVLAEVGGKPITSADITAAVGAPLYRLEVQAYELKRQKLQQLIADRLLAAEAARRKITVAQLLEAELTAKTEPVSEQEIDTLLKAAPSRLAITERDAAHEQARLVLVSRKQAAARQALVQRLAEKARVKQRLAAPAMPRLEMPPQGGIARGSEAAPVTIVEFTDFNCPYCRMAEATVTELQAQFGDKVRYVHRDFPIERLHPQSPLAHMAARCAGEQDRFWSFHDKLLAGAANPGLERIRQHARDSGLDIDAFNQCLSSNRHQAALQEDLDLGARLGVTGTPTFFINGRMLAGAQPLAAFVNVIQEELGRKGIDVAAKDKPSPIPDAAEALTGAAR